VPRVVERKSVRLRWGEVGEKFRGKIRRTPVQKARSSGGAVLVGKASGGSRCAHWVVGKKEKGMRCDSNGGTGEVRACIRGITQAMPNFPGGAASSPLVAENGKRALFGTYRRCEGSMVGLRNAKLGGEFTCKERVGDPHLGT